MIEISPLAFLLTIVPPPVQGLEGLTLTNYVLTILMAAAIGGLAVAFWKSLVIEPDLRYPKHGNQEANYSSEQRRS
ncbi:MAG TPA: hypothetical protein EYQ27_05830, partial [Gemmatimonadetes bacterium]|nr:hypothetical protein [Gemmatimonadota bacterium]